MNPKKKNEPYQSVIAMSVIAWIMATAWMIVQRIMILMETTNPRVAFELWVMGSVAVLVAIAFAIHKEEGP
jgi:hypothetical protein